jgi:type 2 lantibiotic biosynthesis protein LanM
MKDINLKRNTFFSFFGKETLNKKIGEEITETDFLELNKYLNFLLSDSNGIGLIYRKLSIDISSLISKQLFEIIKIPLLYSQNNTDYQESSDTFVICKKDLFESCFNNYKELERIFFLLTKQYLNYFSNLILQLTNDDERIHTAFNISGKPTSINWPLGDFHNGGKTHAILNFSCGKKIVYKVKKPHCNLIVESFIKNLVDFGFNLPYLFPKRLINTESYWEEFIAYEPSDNEIVVKNYYETIGKYLGVFYILGVTDIVRDNIIINNGLPVFIDFECILKPILKSSDKDIYPTADNFFKESVISTGLLPFWTPTRANEAGTNFGGISESELYKQNIYVYAAENGKMVLSYKRILNPKSHLPYKTRKLDAKFIYQNISQGFSKTCSFAIKHKNWIKTEINIIVDSYSFESRILMRHTSVYETLIKESLHPDYLGSTNQRNYFLACLDNTLDEDCFPKTIINIEKENLINIDIPVFYQHPKKKIVFYGHNQDAIIQKSGFDAMTKRLDTLSPKTTKIQEELIAKSIACFEKIEETHGVEKKIATSQKQKNKKIHSGFVRNCIINLGDKIIEDSVPFDDSYQWIDIGVSRTGQWEVTPKKPGLYDGFDGLGLFYLYLFKTTNLNRFKEIAKSLLNKSLFLFKQIDPSKSFYLFSPFNFPFSTLYFLWHFKEVTGEKDIADMDKLIKDILFPFVTNHIHNDSNLDVVNGSAGLLIFLLDYYKHSKSIPLEHSIHLIKNHIQESAILTKNGVTWQSEKFKNLVGFSHGNAGFLYSLSKYYEYFGYSPQDIAFLEKIIHYNNNYYSTEYCGWKDLRYDDRQIAIPSWCHGTSGILLSYLESQKHLPLKLPNLEWGKIADTILKNGFDSFDCLCHGSVGNAEALIAISNFIKEPTLKNAAKEKLLYRIERNQKQFNWRTGFTNGKFSLNGLLLGTSGIGYGLLKIFEDESIPSLLTLQPPILNVSIKN